MPGSITTGTIPALKSANTSEKKSRPGRTMSTAQCAALDPGGTQADGDSVAVAVEPAVRELGVARAAGVISARRRDDRSPVRLVRRHRDQMRSDVCGLGENDALAQPTRSSIAGSAARNCCTSGVIDSASSSNR